MNTPVVKVENLVKRYKDLVALDHFNLEIEEGEIFGLLGPNGSGKTTTINCILSLLSFDKGTIEVFGKEMHPNSYDLKRQIGVVMQNVAVFDDLTVYENIDYFCGLYIRDKKLRKQYIEDAISFVGLEDFQKFYPKKLSGGLLRRLNIACGIAHKPKLIILDELKQMIKKSETITIEILDISKEDLACIRSIKHVYDVNFKNHTLTILCSGGKHNLLRILDTLQQRDLSFGRVYSELPTLNDVFLEITGKELRD